MSARAPFEIAGHTVPPGEWRIVDVPISVLSNHTPVSLRVNVTHGLSDGPVMFVCAAVHGDEILGVEIIRRLLRLKFIRRLRGTLLTIPIVNTFGFINHSRYLPDRRDLNRSFPGSPSGSLAGQLAYTFTKEIIERSTYGIDLHTAAIHRVNLPQIRACLDLEDVKELARVFGAPVMLHANLRDGSLRQAAQDLGVKTLLYEAGEALRFDEYAIRVGVKGVLRVMQHVGMIGRSNIVTEHVRPVMSRSSHWLRAPEGGILRMVKTIGGRIVEGEVVGVISGPFGKSRVEVLARSDGIIIGRTNLPVVNQGDALIHVAQVFDPEKAVDRIDRHEQSFDDDPLFDDGDIL